MNLNTIPGIVKEIMALRKEVDLLKSRQAPETYFTPPAAPIEGTITARRGRPRKEGNDYGS